MFQTIHLQSSSSSPLDFRSAIIEQPLHTPISSTVLLLELPVLLQMGYPLHLRPHSWLSAGQHMPAFSPLKLFHCSKKLNTARFIFQQFFPTLEAVVSVTNSCCLRALYPYAACKACNIFAALLPDLHMKLILALWEIAPDSLGKCLLKHL